MPWFRLDDSFDTHPKVLAAGNEAIGLFIRCGTYSARNLTDGFVPRSVVDLYGSTDLAARLVAVGLWHKARTGWTIHDYLNYNPSRDQVVTQRRSNADRQGRFRERQSSRSEQSRNGVTNGVTNAAPSRPDPSVVSVVTEGARASPLNGRKPDFDKTHLNGAASRHPSAIPFAEAQQRALHPDGAPRGRHARQENPGA